MEKTTEQRIDSSLSGRLEDLEKLFRLYQKGEDEADEELGTFNEYGLSFDYVAPETFDDQNEGYWRYQLSTGGPGDEFRFYASTPHSRPYKIEYWFLDWFEGASRDVSGNELLSEIWDFFEEVESTQVTYDEALNQ